MKNHKKKSFSIRNTENGVTIAQYKRKMEDNSSMEDVRSQSFLTADVDASPPNRSFSVAKTPNNESPVQNHNIFIRHARNQTQEIDCVPRKFEFQLHAPSLTPLSTGPCEDQRKILMNKWFYMSAN